MGVYLRLIQLKQTCLQFCSTIPGWFSALGEEVFSKTSGRKWCSILQHSGSLTLPGSASYLPPMGPKTAASQLSGPFFLFPSILSQPQDRFSWNPCPIPTLYLPTLCLQLKLHNPALYAWPTIVISKSIFEISEKKKLSLLSSCSWKLEIFM